MTKTFEEYGVPEVIVESIVMEIIKQNKLKVKNETQTII